MHVIFQKKGKKRAKKGKIFEKLSKNSKKIEFFLKKKTGDYMQLSHVINY